MLTPSVALHMAALEYRAQVGRADQGTDGPLYVPCRVCGLDMRVLGDGATSHPCCDPDEIPGEHLDAELIERILADLEQADI